MTELGLADRVQVFSGTSAGAINAAAFATVCDPEKVQQMWLDRIEEIPRVKWLDALLKGTGNLWTQLMGVQTLICQPNLTGPLGSVFDTAMSDLYHLITNPGSIRGILNREGLEGLLREFLPSQWPESNPCVYATALESHGVLVDKVNPSSYQLTRFALHQEPDIGRRLRKILASTAIPWGFDSVEIDGKQYIDGGWDEMGGDNTPLHPILDNHPEVNTVYVVRCNCRSKDPGHCRKRMDGRRIVEIRPQTQLPGVLDGLNFLGNDQISIWSGTLSFSRHFAEMYANRGYEDAKKTLAFESGLNWD